MHHGPNIWAVVFLGAGLRCGWALMAFWCAVAYAAIVAGLCLFFKGCSVREGEEAIQCKKEPTVNDVLNVMAKYAGPPVRPKDIIWAPGLVPVEVVQNGKVVARGTEQPGQFRTSPGEFLAEKKPKSTAASSGTSGPSRSGTKASGRSSKTAARSKSQWRQNKK
jgi:hypothetical protein